MEGSFQPRAPWDYRHRYALHIVVFALAFWAPWVHFGSWRFHTILLTERDTWSLGMAELARSGFLGMSGAAVGLLLLSVLALGLGGWLRTWGSAYLSNAVVQSSEMHRAGNATGVLADGPFRHVRNPLYLGTFLHTLGLCLILTPTGALFAVVLIGLLQLRLISVEEPYLRRTLGEPYIAYCRAVPRLLPSLPARVPATGARPQWLQAVLGELYMVSVPVGFLLLGWRYNGFLLVKVVLVALGMGLIAKALVPARVAAPAA